jgi:serine/threonine protein kinase
MSSDSVRPGQSSHLGPGTVLDGKYEILKRIGVGGMGEVFKARHVHLNALRCIKVMKQSLLADEVYRMRFLREARLATQIHHPNIAVVHDFFVGDGGSYMVTEFIDGTTLRQWSAAHGPFPIPLAADVASQVLAGLEHIHRRGLMHRDISPDNVMLSYDADDRLEAKIIDLGIAKDVNTAASDKTMAGVLIGNPKYMSPEQLGLIAEGEEIDGRTDLYSLGVVLYEMLLGVPPFASETPQGYIMKHLTQPPARFADARPGVEVPAGIEQVVFRSLEKDRGRRFRDAPELAAALKPFLEERAGTLTREDVSRLRRGPEKTLTQFPLPVIGSNDATIAEAASTEMKALAFEQSLLDDVQAREDEGDREALVRLAEAHPRGSRVGDAARGALARLAEAQERDRREEELFQRAWEDGRASALRAFLDEHPDSPRAARAQTYLDEALAFESAESSESETAVRQFLTVWPEGRHHLEAEIRLVTLRQQAAAEAFAKAKNADTYAAVSEFLARFSMSADAGEARSLAEERLAFESAAVTDTTVAWDAWLAKWPDDPHAGDARARREHARAREEGQAFEEARISGRAALQEFMERYAGGPFIKDAKRALKEFAEADDFAQAESAGTLAAWRLYLSSHPSGARTAEARKQVKALEAAAERARATEPEDFLAAFESGTSEAWDQFLREHPESERNDEAHLRRQEAADFELATTTNKSSMWRAFLKTWPEGRHALDAALRLRR